MQPEKAFNSLTSLWKQRCSQSADKQPAQCPQTYKPLSLLFLGICSASRRRFWCDTSSVSQVCTHMLHPLVSPPSPSLHSGLTCLQQHLSPVQVLHLVAVVLRVCGAGAGGPGLGPVHFSESLGMELQGVHPTLPGQVQHHPAGHHVPAAEHRRTVHLRRVEDDVKLFQLVENHFICRLCESSEKRAFPLLLLCRMWSLLKRIFGRLQLTCLKTKLLISAGLRTYLEAEEVGGISGFIT